MQTLIATLQFDARTGIDVGHPFRVAITLNGKWLYGDSCPSIATAMNWILARYPSHIRVLEPLTGDAVILDENGYPIKDCPNCLDQASIAAPGQTTLCKTHADEKHYAEMKEFFIEEIERLQFKSTFPFCSACGTDKQVFYIGVIPSMTCGFLNFSFCVDCRNELTLKKNAAIGAQERIGA